MSAPTTQQAGYNYIVKIGGTEIGGGTDATLNRFQNLTEATNKGSGMWRNAICGVRGWSIDVSGMYLEGAEECGSTLALTVTGDAAATVKGITNVTMNVSANNYESVNSTTGLARELVAGTRSVSLTVEGEWYDIDLDSTPTGGDEGLEEVLTVIDGTASATTLTAALTFGGTPQAYTIVGRPSAFSLSAPAEGIMTYSFTIESTAVPAAPTLTSSDAGLLKVIGSDSTGLWNLAAAGGNLPLTVLLIKQGTATDYTQFTGTCYTESLSVNIPYSGVITCDATFAGSGALTASASA